MKKTLTEIAVRATFCKVLLLNGALQALNFSPARESFKGAYLQGMGYAIAPVGPCPKKNCALHRI